MNKYALIELHKIDTDKKRQLNKVEKAMELLREAGVLNECCAGPALPGEGGITHPPGEAKDRFFVIKLKDQFAANALFGYVKALNEHLASVESVDEIERMSKLGGSVVELMDESKNHPNRAVPA